MLWFILACETPAPAVAEPVNLGTVTASTVDGTSGETVEVTADVIYGAAFGYDKDDGKGGHNLMVFVVSDPKAKCSEVSTYLAGSGQGGSKDWDPSPFSIPGECTLTFSSPSYDTGGIDVSVTADEKTTDATVSLYCADPDGQWVIGDTNEKKDGWMYDGVVWQSHATSMSVAVSGGGGDAYEWSLSADAWSGGYLYNIDQLDVPGTGTVKGEGAAESCGAMGSLTVF